MLGDISRRDLAEAVGVTQFRRRLDQTTPFVPCCPHSSQLVNSLRLNIIALGNRVIKFGADFVSTARRRTVSSDLLT